MKLLNSKLGWVDFSSLERDRVSQVLSILQEKGTLDELGIGQIRDAFADKLFPGISTIQTRAKYFVTLPYIFHDYRNLSIFERSKTTLYDYLSEREDELARQLVNNHKNAIPPGIIGKESLDSGVSRKPSSVYWNGLRQLSIINAQLSLREFVAQYQDLLNSKVKEHEEDDEPSSVTAHMVPKPDCYEPQWLDDVSLELTEREAEFLRSRLLTSSKTGFSILTQVFKHRLENRVLTTLENTTNSSWQIEALYECLKDSPVSPNTKECLKKALEFSFVLKGAHIRYNILLANKSGNSDFKDNLEDEFALWLEQARSNQSYFTQDNIDSWYQLAFGLSERINKRTRKFIEGWCHLIMTQSPTRELDKCVRVQAIANKEGRCLLNKALSEQQGWVGMYNLEFRWPTARTILRDIQEGLSVKS
ncbi:MAG: hypothetical protein CMM76_17075 [Rhodospirillaceae bacterium]|nr:hypothetical protein [Rhodospirillaceae bacterium]|tara:strand:+ start:11238 stop:12494 length:1257 start_codon:yes stop_codon:yes gene_type:complete